MALELEKIFGTDSAKEAFYKTDRNFQKIDEGIGNIDVSEDIQAHDTSETSHSDIREQINDLRTDVGDKTTLITTDKTNLVNAVNETKAQINDFADQVVSKKVEATSTDDATSITNAPLKTAGGLAVAKSAYIGDKLVLGNGFNARHIVDFSSISSLGNGQQLRVRMKITPSVYNYIKLYFSGGRTDVSSFNNSRIVAFESDYIVHIYADSSVLDVENGKFEAIGSITQDNILWQNVGSNSEVDLIIKNADYTQQSGYGVLIIEAIGKNNINIIDVQIEDIPV
jgi:hypothetical protein